MGRTIVSLRGARSEAVLVSPYLIPGAAGVAQMAQARQRGVAVRIITNSMATTDETLVAAAYQRYRRPMLEAGVELFELSSNQLKADRRMRKNLGASKGSLHAKLAIIDRRTVLLGSLNLDPRSAWTNTELGVRIDSAELAEQIGGLPVLATTRGVYRVTLAPNGAGLRWTALTDPNLPDGDSAGQVFDDEPEVDWATRLKATLLSIFVPESLL
jgi:cardiolipin synthase C